MSGPAGAPSPATVEGWLRDLGLEPGERADREAIAAWDLVLDGYRRHDLRVTLILDPSLGAIAWAHLAPPIGDGLRKTYGRLLRWNDEFPLAKFSIADDGRPILAVEIPARWLDAEELGLALARILAIADRIFDDTRGWLWIGGRVPDGYVERPARSVALLERHRGRLGELLEAPAGEGASGAPTAGGELPSGDSTGSIIEATTRP
jgi:Putative bacterial sensory transduction regulator